MKMRTNFHKFSVNSRTIDIKFGEIGAIFMGLQPIHQLSNTLYDRTLLAKLSKCAWNVIAAYLKSTVPDDEAVPGASIAVQTYGDFLNFNPHLHAIVSDGCFLKDGSFQTAPVFMLENLEEAFQYEVLKNAQERRKNQ